MAVQYVSHFIGRHEEREQIKEVLVSTDIHVIQIYGLPSVGKTELIRQVCQEISSEHQVRIIFRRITNGQWPNIELCQLLEDIRKSEMLSIIILDGFDNLSDEEEFNQFCLENLWNLHRLKIILVFQGLFPLKIGGFPNEKFQVKPMNKEDARCLFYRKTKLTLDHHSEQQVDELIDYCGALPGQIIELTNKISQFPSNISLAEIYEFIKENKSFCQSKDIFAKLDRYIKSLTPKQCHTLSEVVYFPGTFTVRDVTEIASYRNDLDSKFWFLYPLLSYGLLKSTDENNQQFQVPSLFQDYANQKLAHLRHEDTTKLKFSTIIGKTLIEAEQLWQTGLIYDALGIMTNNWTNVQKLLQQAIHSPSDGNSFQIYYKVVIAASNVISLCYPNEAKLFCRAVVDNAQIFGSEDQRALSMASYGHTLVESSENEALQLYKASERILRKYNNHQYQLIILLYNMSNAYYRCGKLQNGIRCAREALSIQVADKDADEIQHVKTYAASFLAYNLIFATEYKQAEEILQKTLQEVGESGHPTVPTLLNSLGLKEERSKGDPDKALTCYFASLAKKRKVAEFQEPLLVTTLCNVAGQLSKTKRRHDFALKFLFEAEDIRRRAGWVHAYSGLVVWNIGMVFMRKRMIVEALMKIKEAEKLYEAVNCNHYVNAEVKVWLAHCHLLLDNAQEAKQIFLEVVRNGEMYHELRPQGEFVLNALEHLVHLSVQDPKEQQSYITKVLRELPRLNQCPGVGAINLKKYRQLLIKYAELLLKISNDNAKSEPRSGIFLQCIPDNCLACLEVINYTICPKDIYLQKMSLLTPPYQFFDKMDCTTARSQVHREQTENKIGRRYLGTLTTGVCRTSKETDDNFSLPKSEISSESSYSNILPLPVKELCESRAHSKSVDSHQKVLNGLPDFDALFSPEENDADCENDRVLPEARGDISARLKSSAHFESIDRYQEVLNGLPDFDALFSPEENCVNCENNRVLPEARREILAKPIGSSETNDEYDTGKSIHKSFSSNLSGESRKLFGRNENISKNKQLRDSQNLTRIHQPKHSKDDPVDTFNKKVDIKFSDYSATLNGAGTNQVAKSQTFPRSQRSLEDPKTKQNSIIPPQQIANIKEKNSGYLYPPNKQHLLDSSQRLKTNPIKEQHNAEQFWRNYGSSRYDSKTRTEPKKASEKRSLRPFEDKNLASKYSNPSTSQKPFSTIPAELVLSNACSSAKTGQNCCDANANFDFDSPKSQSNFVSSRLPTNAMSMNRFSQLPTQLTLKREPVEHEERLD